MRRIANRRLRYLAPAGVAGVVALAAGIPALTAGASPSNLPPITAQALIAKVEQANVPALQGSVTWNANLGLPDLSGLTSGNDGQVSTTTGFDPTTLLSGSQTIDVWRNGSSLRLALPRTMAETDLVKVGDQAWLYDSTNQHVTHFVPAPSSGASQPAKTAPTGPAGTPLTPDQQAARILGNLGPSTRVTAAPGDEVAGQPAYLLTLSPQPGSKAASETTLSRATISVDADNGLPLAVAIYAAGATAPVLQVGYTSVSFATPAASNFATPVGTSTSTQTVNPPAGGHPESPPSSSNGASFTGPPWAWIVSAPSGTLSSGVDRVLYSSAVQGATTPVQGSFGTARLLHTAVINVLFLPNGEVLAGFVTPATLEAKAATPSSTSSSPTTAAGSVGS